MPDTTPSGWTGRRLGVYEVQGLLGAGGMGEVYRALDTKLGRDVAIKILPDALTRDPERLVRFEREARVLASLNHPHIGAIYGLEESDGAKALVLELVEGETLADRISRRALPVTEALAIARQIADALDAAHEKGIVHRDLKPANVMLQGARGSAALNVKLLDFGLAKLTGTDGAGGDFSQAPTHIADGTFRGTILGTPAYMSPEQARGVSVDKRTDIWAFGCVLYEMLTGRRAFAGATMSDTIAAIIEREPAWDALPGTTPSRVSDLLRRCLQKDPTRRLRDVGDARSEIDEALAPRASARRFGPWPVAAAIAILVSTAGGFWAALRPGRPSPAGQSQWEPLTNFPDSATQPALSPDGRMLTFLRGPGTFQSQGQVYVKLLPGGEAVPLTSDGLTKMSPVFSPDGTRIAYTVNDIGEPWNTWVVPTLRGQPSRWLHNASGLTWLDPDRILFSEIKPGTVGHMGIVTSNLDRSTSRVVYFPNADGMAHRSAVSPNRTSVLLAEMNERGVWLPCRLVPLSGDSPGQVVGPAGAFCTQVAWAPDGGWMYFSADVGDGFHLWRQRAPGTRPEQITFGPSVQEGLAIAPDGRSLITSVGLRQRGVWLHDASGDERQISEEGYAFWPLFSSDGRTLCYRRAPAAVTGNVATELWMTELDSGRTERLLPGQLVTQYDLSRDDRVVASVQEADGRSRLWLAWLDGREAPRRIPGAEGVSPRFGSSGEIWFRATEGGRSFLFLINEDGTDFERCLETLALSWG